jgi:predicted ArsR family transcriptional regulator
VKVKGYTVTELSELLEIKPNAVRQRLLVAGIKPVVAEYIYPLEAFEKLKEAPPRGRPKKLNTGKPRRTDS